MRSLCGLPLSAARPPKPSVFMDFLTESQYRGPVPPFDQLLCRKEGADRTSTAAATTGTCVESYPELDQIDGRLDFEISSRNIEASRKYTVSDEIELADLSHLMGRLRVAG